MRQLTNAEKQQLEGKIKKEQERQQTLREKNPDLPESFEEANGKTSPFYRFKSGKRESVSHHTDVPNFYVGKTAKKRPCCK